MIAGADEPKKSWSVQVLDENGDVAWKWNAADGIDASGDAWRNGGHRIIAAVVYCLSGASLQAEKMPDDPHWVYPFNLSKGTFHRCGKQIALGNTPLSLSCGCQHAEPVAGSGRMSQAGGSSATYSSNKQTKI